MPAPDNNENACKNAGIALAAMCRCGRSLGSARRLNSGRDPMASNPAAEPTQECPPKAHVPKLDSKVKTLDENPCLTHSARHKLHDSPCLSGGNQIHEQVRSRHVYPSMFARVCLLGPSPDRLWVEPRRDARILSMGKMHGLGTQVFSHSRDEPGRWPWMHR
jgi:hypothetical protein